MQPPQANGPTGLQEGRIFTFDYILTPNIEDYEKNYRELATCKVDMFLAVSNWLPWETAR